MYEITVRAAAELMLSPILFGIEDAAEALPAILRALSVQYAERHDIEDYTSVGLLEIALAGWSEAEQRMRFWQFLSYEGYQAQDDGGNHYGVLPFPRLPAEYIPAPDGFTTDEHLVAIIKGAGRCFADNPAAMGPIRVGGEVLAVDITPQGISTRTLHRFEDYEQTRHAAAAIVGRVVRGDLHVSVADGLTPVDESIDLATGKSLRPKPANDRTVNRAERRRAERLARKAGRAAA